MINQALGAMMPAMLADDVTQAATAANSGDASQAMMVASVVVGAAVLVLVYSLADIVMRDPSLDSLLREDELQRRKKLRAGSDVYRLFESLVDELVDRVVPSNPNVVARLRVDLMFADPLPWKPGEYLAVAAVKGLLAGGFMLVVALLVGLSPVMMFLAVGGSAFGLYFLESNRVTDMAARKRLRFKRRLPFAVDLMASMLAAGAVFVEAMRTVARENAGHPLGDEFDRVIRETEMGRPRREALEALDRRVGDPDLSELVFAINKGEELGTKLSDIFANIAEQIRLKRTQWAEKAAGAAQVMMAFPGLLTMLACLFVVVAPFVLKAFFSL